ncbi:FAD-dependent monooxygenase [Natrinema sp. 1APR25-10V2]|uniref:FAD-dependent oxidoreductase n=1 Tax=Natrinema sp. 1APR25-10V2 TaxID=2951081 RepID=UPI002875EFE2|nr:FAD-dependent monooxygenase [Natrinema sp. 1APR25-10V2]MDS0476837.1 FAD-dependent monooxygenase [Natrinema sp. 1APR25-10V2]
MTLATIPRYDPDRVATVGDHAVVVGASMAGLSAARVLADGFERVTIVEQDPLPDEPVARNGVPQARHVHLLLEAGRATLEDLFPGYCEDLLSAGGLVIDGLSDIIHYEEGDYLADGPCRMPIHFATRPLFEQILRRRVARLDAITLRPDCQFVKYIVAEEAPTVGGVVVREKGTEQERLTADLVVDATGRTSRTPTWLENHGYSRPPVDEVRIDVAYSTATVERPATDRRNIFVPPSPPRTRGGAAFPIEDGRWLVTLFGVHGDRPPTDVNEFKSFAASLPTPDLEHILESCPWVTEDISHYPFPSNIWRHYEELDRVPEGLIVTGDAICSFNPLYGQGMSVAALESLVLHHELASTALETLPKRFFDRTDSVIAPAWMTAVGSDFEFPQTTGPKPRGTALINRYMSRLFRKAQSDGQLRELFYRVLMMEEPPESLFHPTVVWRVLKPRF